MTDSAEIFVGLDKETDEVIVNVDGKRLGPAKDLLRFVGDAYVECERRRAVPEPDWLEGLRKL